MEFAPCGFPSWINSEPDIQPIIERAEKDGNVKANGSIAASMLLQAVELGIDPNNVARSIIVARNGVRVPKRLEQIAKVLERYDAAQSEQRAAETDADNSKLREFVNGSPRNRVRRLLAKGWRGKRAQPEPSREDEQPT